MARGVILRLLNIDRGADEPVAGHPPLHQRSGGVTESMAAASLLRQLAGALPVVGRDQVQQRIAGLRLGTRMGP